MRTLRNSNSTLMNLGCVDGIAGRLRAKTALILVTVLCAIALPLPGDIYAQDPWPQVGGTPTTINDGSGNQRDTRISGTLVTYYSVVGGTSEVRYHDLLTGVDLAIPTEGALDFQPDVDGSRLVYTHVASDEFAIYAFDPADASQPPAELDQQPGSLREKAAIGGQTVAWIDYGFDNDAYHAEIVVYDLSTGSATRLTNDDYYHRDPDVSPDGSMAVWTRCEVNLSGCCVWQATRSGAGWSVAQLSGDRESTAPALDSQFVAYQGSDANGESDIYWRALGGGEEHRISLSGGQQNPAITRGLSTGTWTLRFTASGDPVTHSLQLDVR
jgi:Tol biopolymer transport system component